MPTPTAERTVVGLPVTGANTTAALLLGAAGMLVSGLLLYAEGARRAVVGEGALAEELTEVFGSYRTTTDGTPAMDVTYLEVAAVGS